MLCRLPVTARVTWVSEDIQPLHPGVSRNGARTPPVLPSSLPHPGSALITPFCVCCSSEPKQGGPHYDTSHVWKLPEGGGGILGVHMHTVILYTPLLMYSAFSHTHTHRLRALRPPVVALATLRQIQTLRSKQNQSPPPSSAAESSGARSVPASLFKSGLKRRADLHTYF